MVFQEKRTMASITMQSRFFIYAYPRSGSSLFRALLNAHSQIAVPPECGFIQWLGKDYQFAQFSVSDWWQLIVKTKKFETWGLQESDFLRTSHGVGGLLGFREFVDHVQRIYGSKSGKEVKVWGDKNNYYIYHIPEIRALFPDALSILLVRNPAECISSIVALREDYESPFAPNLSKDVGQQLLSWMEVHRSVAWQSNTLTIHFSDLVSQPELTLNRVFNRLQVVPEPVAEYFFVVNDEPPETLAWKSRVRSEIEPQRSNQQIVAHFEAHLDPALHGLYGEAVALYQSFSMDHDA